MTEPVHFSELLDNTCVTLSSTVDPAEPIAMSEFYGMACLTQTFTGAAPTASPQLEQIEVELDMISYYDSATSSITLRPVDVNQNLERFTGNFTWGFELISPTGNTIASAEMLTDDNNYQSLSNPDAGIYTVMSIVYYNRSRVFYEVSFNSVTIT